MKHVIAYFFNGDVTSIQLMPIFWKAVAVLELSLNLWIIAAVNDGASPNRKFFRLHSNLAQDLKCDVVYKTLNSDLKILERERSGTSDMTSNLEGTGDRMPS